MPPPSQSQQGQQPDNAYTPVWITVLLFVVGFSIWYAFHEYIVAIIFKVKLFEAQIVSLFTPALHSVIAKLQATSPAEVSFSELWSMSSAVGYYTRFPLLVILVILSAILYANDITKRYRKTYSMNELLQLEYVNWPNVAPVLKLKLTTQDLDEGPWAVAASPRAFAEKYHLIKRDVIEQKPTVRRERGFVSATINRGETKRIFTMQLGDYWTNPDALPPHTKALFAMFAAKINHDRNTVNAMLAQLSNSTASGSLDYSGINELLAKHKDSEEVVKIYQRHAYILTVMASMVQKARDDGVLPTAQFLWLKPIDRRLWYMLNSVGRQTPFAEVGGPFAHWLAEKELKKRCIVPMVDEAVNALEAAIKEIKFKEEELPA